MTGSYLTPRLHTVAPTPPASEGGTGVWLELRHGSNRPLRRELGSTPFRVGGAPDCELRLPGANTPALICELTLDPAGQAHLRRLDPAFPILRNGQPVPPDAPIPLMHGDRLAVGSLDVTLHRASVHLRPHLEPDAPPPTPPVRNATAEQAAELDADRALWYRRRQEFEAEMAQARAELTELAGELSRREGELAVRHAELERFRDELASVRAGLLEQYEERRTQLDETQSLVDGATAHLQAKQEAWEAERARRDAEQAARVADLARERADLDAGRADLRRDALELEEQLRLAAEEQDRLRAEAAGQEAKARELSEAEARMATATEGVAGRQRELDAERERLRQSREQQAATAAAEREAIERRAATAAAEREAIERRAAEVAARERDVAARLAEAQTRAVAGAEVERLTHLRDELAAMSAGIETREADLVRRTTRLQEAGRVVAQARRDLAAGRAAWAAEQAAHRDSWAAEQAANRVSWAAEQAAKAEAWAKKEREFRQVVAQAQDEFEALRAGVEPLIERSDVAQAEVAAARDELDRRAAEVYADLERRELALERERVAQRETVLAFQRELAAWRAEVEATPVPVPAVQTAPAPASPQVPTAVQELQAWLRRRFRELAATRSAGPAQPPEPVDPGDRHLGDLLRQRDAVDADALAALIAEAQRQRRTLRSVLLSGGAVTLYQLAHLETGNLGGLLLGRLRVLDRLRVTPREVVYRVFDPERPDGPSRGVYTLRHLSEAEMDDAVRPDEFRQRFAAARDAAHPNLAATAEVLEIQGRPAALVEAVAGLPGPEWPAEAALPGLWLRLLTDAARGLEAAHRHGLAHGRLSGDSFVLTPGGAVKVVGVGEPMWLATGVAAAAEPAPSADLRALGPVAFAWSQLGQPAGRKRGRKGPPEPLAAVLKRLDADTETPMADTVGGAVPYRHATELVAELTRLAPQFPCPPDAWERLLAHAAGAADGGLRQSA